MGFIDWVKSKFRKEPKATPTKQYDKPIGPEKPSSNQPSYQGPTRPDTDEQTFRDTGKSTKRRGGSRQIPKDANDIISGNWYAGDKQGKDLTPQQEQDIIAGKDVGKVVRGGGAKKIQPAESPSPSTSQPTPNIEANKLNPSVSDSSGRLTAQRPYDVKANTPFSQKLGGFVRDYTVGLPDIARTSLQMAFGVGGQELNPIGAVTNLFSPFDRFAGEDRVGNKKIGVDQGTGIYNPNTKRFESNLPTGYDKLDEQTIANPNLLLPPNVAYQQDYSTKVKEVEAELRPSYEARANRLADAYQTNINSGSISQPDAQAGYEADMERLNKEYQQDVQSKSYLSPTDSKRYRDSVKFREDYASFTKDIAIQPSTLLTAGVLVGGGAVGGLPAVAVNTAVGVQGASTTVSSIPEFAQGNIKTGAIKLGVGSAMFVAGTYGAMRIAGNMITQQQIIDVANKKGTTTFTRTSISKYNFQDDFSGMAKTSNARITRYGSATYKYNPATKTYSVTGGQTNKVLTTDYWTGKPLAITNYQTFSGVGEQVSSGTITGKYWGGSVRNLNYGSPSKVKEVLTRVEYDTQYTYSNLGGKESIAFGGKSGGATYQSFVVSGKGGKVLSITGTSDNVYMMRLGSSSTQTFTTASGARINIQTSTYSKFPKSSIGIQDSLSAGFIEKPEGVLNWKATGNKGLISKYGQPKSTVYEFQAFANTGLKARFYQGTQMLEQAQTPSLFNQPVTSQGLVRGITRQQYSSTFATSTPSSMLSTIPAYSTTGTFALIAPTIAIGELSLRGENKLRTTPLAIGTFQPTRILNDTTLATSTKVDTRSTTRQLTNPVGAIVPSIGAGGLFTGGLIAGLPFLNFGGGSLGFGSGAKNVGAKQKFRYTPDYTSLITGRRGAKGKSIFGTETYAGFESRPITNAWGKFLSTGLGIGKKKKKKGGRK